MNFELINISVQSDQGVVQLSQLSDSLEAYVNDLNVQAINKVGALGLKAMRSAVPVWTRELADTDIQIDYAKKSQEFRVARVYVKSGPHGFNGIDAGELASTLDKGKGIIGYLKRRKTTTPVSPFTASFSAGSPTAGWIGDGYNLFLDALNRTEL